jgi:hypothetical protein
METWNLEQTRKNVERLYGRTQLQLAAPCLRSVVERQGYAYVHYQDFRKLLQTYLQSNAQHPPETYLWWLAHEEGQEQFNEFILRVGAQVIACVQSLHAIPDILSHAVYFSLGLNMDKPLPPQVINFNSVVKELGRVPDAVELRRVLISFNVAGAHLSALVNRAKHISVVSQSFSEDWTGLRAERHVILMGGFEHRGALYPEVAAKDFLQTEFDRITKLFVNAGIELNVLLDRRPSGLPVNSRCE